MGLRMGTRMGRWLLIRAETCRPFFMELGMYTIYMHLFFMGGRHAPTVVWKERGLEMGS